MLGFILSKMNLLILVTAIFAIVGFFTIGLIDITEVNEASELASRLKEKSFALANASNFCLSDSYDLPKDFFIAGRSFLYVLKVSTRTIDVDGDHINILIFSVFPRREIQKSYQDSSYLPKAIAAQSFRTSSIITLYSQEYNYDETTSTLAYMGEVRDDWYLEDEIIVDPQAINPANQLELIREVIDGKPYLYVIACNSARCEADKTFVGETVHEPDPANDIDGGFRC